MRVAWILFAFGLVLRVLFWAAGPDGGSGWHVGFQGDAPIWQDQAARLARGMPDAELRLPWRAPGMMWVVSLCSDGGANAWPVRLLFLAAGASIAPLLWLLLRRCVDATVAMLAAGLCAASTNLLLLSSGLQVGALYLPLALLALCDQTRLTAGHRVWLPLRWGALHGVLCLLRTENLLCFVVLVLVAKACGARWRSLLLASLACGAALLPWQITAAQMVRDFNSAGPPPPPLSLPWDAAATKAVLELPAFQHQAVFELVDATVRLRGGDHVAVQDLAIVREAYGTWPEPLPVPLIALNGPLNFFLANSREADGGFSRAAFDRAPPLAGGASHYPSWLRLPPGEHRRFSLGYPPHLAIALRGYSLGIDELLADPLEGSRRVLGKLIPAAAGATGGVGGYALPIGLSGTRRAVDMVTAEGWWAVTWRIVVLVTAACGLWRLRANRGLWPLLAFSAVNLLVIVLFFGHARHGTHCLPAVALGTAALLALAVRHWPAARSQRLGLLLIAALLLIEAMRAITVTATIDSCPVFGLEPFAANDFADRVVEFR